MSGATCRKRSVLPGVILCGLLVGPMPLFAQTIEFEERVEAQRAIEEVRSRHRIQAAGIQAAKLPSERHLEDKVESYLAKSLALTNVWNRTISGSDLQAELERMARDTKDPDRLRELFAALDDDPRLLAECLARPLLVDRTIRELYSFDARIHAPLREKIDAGAGGGATIEFDVARKDGDWPAFDRLPIGEVSDLVETAHYFQKETVIEKSDGVLRVSRTRWTKQPFDSWWVAEGPERDVPVRAIPTQTGEGTAYSLPQAPEAACTDDTWLATSTGSGVPDPREEHTAVWTGTEMIVWGGRDPSPLATGASYDPATDSWTPLPTGGSAPTARFRHSTVWTGTEMIVWGGFGTVFENSGARYDPGLNSWTATTIDVATPTPRAQHSAVWTGTGMVIWGGLDAIGFPDTGGVYEPPPGTDSWKATAVAAVPTGRANHSTVWTGTEMIVWGGYDGLLDVNTGGRYDPALNVWTATSTGPNTPSERENQTAVWTGTEMIMWGGIGFQADSSGGRYDPATDSWLPTSLTGAPGPRRWHTAVWTDVEMIIWSGLAAGTTGARYQPVTDSWTATSTAAGVPAGRRHHTAVWLGPGETKMIVWGGVTSTRTNTGGIYCTICTPLDWYPDLDLDGFGDTSLPQSSCEEIPGLILDGSDCDDGSAAVYPTAPQICDGLNNDCLDAGWPGLAGTNEFDNDGDTLSSCAGDCNDADIDNWMLPGPVRDLFFAADKQTLGWTVPLLPGSTLLDYDTVRADTPTTFDVAGTCVETDDGTDLLSLAPAEPLVAEVFFYLVRPQNGCGQGSVGTDSDGVPRVATDCP